MIQFILNNKTLILVGILSLALAGSGVYIKLLKSDLEVAHSEKRELETKLSVSNASIASLRSAIDEQNSAIEKMKKDADARAEAGKIIVDKAKQEAQKYKRRADELIKLQPTPGKTQCESAEALINEEIRSEK